MFAYLFAVWAFFLVILTASCGGSAIGDAQEFSPNEPPSIISIKAVNFDGTEITQLDIEPYKQFKLIIEAVDPDNNRLEYKFDSASGTFAGISSNSNGCTAVFKTGSIKGGQNIELWAMVTDGKGALVRQSFNLGTGKTGPAIVASLEKIRFRPTDKIKLSVSANCSGFFQLYCDGPANFDFEKDMYRYSYGSNKTTDFILAGPNCTSYADMVLEAKPGCVSDTDYVSEEYELVLVFRDGLFQENSFPQTITIDGMPPQIDTFSQGNGSSTDLEVVVTFNENIGYAASSSLKIDSPDGKVRLKSITGKDVVFSVSGLKALTQYTATISGIKDIAGNEMVSAAKSFKTKFFGNGRFSIWNDPWGVSYTAYCGFENIEFQLQAQDENGNHVSSVSYSSSDSNLVSVNTSGYISVKTENLDNIDKQVVITGRYLGNEAKFIVNIKTWYPVTKAEDFADGGVIAKNLKCKFILMNDIDFALSSNDKIKPIGSGTNPFTGVFDGGKKTLSNFEIVAQGTNDHYASLFSHNEGTIINLFVKNAELSNENLQNIGIICGYNYTGGIIEKCYVEDSAVIGENSVGGIAGLNLGEINECKIIRGRVIAKGNNIAGGIAGTNQGYVRKCINDNAMVYAKEHVGGLIGVVELGKVEDCSSDVNLASGEGITIINKVGGLIGYARPNDNISTVEIINCYSTGLVTVSGANNVGGLIGYAENAKISQCYSDCIVVGKNYVGGLIGNMDYTNVTNCYSRQTVNGSSYAGGLIGYILNKANSTVSTSYSEAVVVSTNPPHGELIGFVPGVNETVLYTDCFCLNQNFDSIFGSDKNQGQMQDIDTYLNSIPKWDISSSSVGGSIWRIYPGINRGFPYLRSVPPK
ncbi:MAG TPA: Ig-like domain-containing protein [Spirochaetota bacterium]|nr:Ig-like domain-containing protein [Spirochaetota bacterium]